jgi:hypothetical protein
VKKRNLQGGGGLAACPLSRVCCLLARPLSPFYVSRRGEEREVTVTAGGRM